jgi:hypothetical protein
VKQKFSNAQVLLHILQLQKRSDTPIVQQKRREAIEHELACSKFDNSVWAPSQRFLGIFQPARNEAVQHCKRALDGLHRFEFVERAASAI